MIKLIKYLFVVFLMLVGTPNVFASTDSVKVENSDVDFSKGIPNPISYVSDFAGMFPKDKVDELNSKLSNYQKTSGMEIAVVTITSLGQNTDISSFATDVFHKWGVGKKGANNGILIALSKNDHKWEIRTGYGSEIVLPDALCSRFGRNELVPSLKAGDYIGGVNKLVDAIIKQVGTNSADIQKFKNDYRLKQEQQSADLKDTLLNVFLSFVFIIILIVVSVFSIKRYKKIKELKEQSQKLIDKNINATKLFYLEVSKNKDNDYVKNQVSLFETYIKESKITDIPTSDLDMISKQSNHSSKISNFIYKVNEFNKAYENASLSDSYVSETINYIKKIEAIENELVIFNIKSKKYTIEKDVLALGELVKTNMNNERIFSAINTLTAVYDSIKQEYERLYVIKTSIPNMKSKLENYKSNIPKWNKDLKDHCLDKYIITLSVYLIELEALMLLGDAELFNKYDKYKQCEDFVNKSISDEVYRLKRIVEEEEAVERRRKRRIQEEEEESRRSSYYSSSSYSSSSYDSGSSSSDFGGFGGGDTGGGGSSGSW